MTIKCRSPKRTTTLITPLVLSVQRIRVLCLLSTVYSKTQRLTLVTVLPPFVPLHPIDPRTPTRLFRRNILLFPQRIFFWVRLSFIRSRYPVLYVSGICLFFERYKFLVVTLETYISYNSSLTSIDPLLLRPVLV